MVRLQSHTINNHKPSSQMLDLFTLATSVEDTNEKRAGALEASSHQNPLFEICSAQSGDVALKGRRGSLTQ